MTRRNGILPFVIAVLCIAALSAPLGLRFWRSVSWARQQRIGAELIEALRDQCPEAVPAKTWEHATGWAITAYHNVCFSESHVSIDELVRFNHDARVRLARQVDLNTIDWVWKRLAETGPHGQKYIDKFESEYRAIVYPPETGNTTL